MTCPAAASAPRPCRGTCACSLPTYEGRAPATPGEDRTIEYLVAEFKKAGVQPAGDGGGWTQSVPLNAPASTDR